MSHRPRPQRVAVTGASGLLGRTLVPLLAARGHEVIVGVHKSRSALPEGATAVNLDLLDRASIVRFVELAAADWIVHAAAMTDVDGCEKEAECAEALNSGATVNLMLAVAATSSRVLYVSTDYVFDGRSGPYDEDNEPHPINIYGCTKLVGEDAVRACGRHHAVIRSAGFLGVGPPNRPTFAESMINRMRNSPPLPVAVDQRSNITPVDYLAAAIAEIGESRRAGLWHVAGPEILSRYEFALRLAQLFHLGDGVVKSVKYRELRRRALRPLNGGLTSKRKLRTEPVDLDAALRSWKADLESYPRSHL